MNLNFCVGCGVKKQTKNTNEIGYIRELGMLYCQRCHDINNFNELPKLNHSSTYYYAKLFEVCDQVNEVYWVVDVFDFSPQVLEIIQKLNEKKNKITILLNKIDILPKSISEDSIIKWCNETLSKIKYANLFLLSSYKYINIDMLMDDIKMKKTKVLFAGYTNSGKSSLINTLMKSAGLSHSKITTSNYVGTTLDKIEINFGNGMVIIDTPGLVADKSIYKFLGKKSVKLVSPKKELKPITYQIDEKSSILIESLIAFNVSSTAPFSITFYIPRTLNLHRTKFGNSIALLTKHFKGDFFQIPNEEDSFSLDDYDLIQYKLMDGNELAISNIGFFKLKASSEVKVELFKNKNLNIYKKVRMFNKN